MVVYYFSIPIVFILAAIFGCAAIAMMLVANLAYMFFYLTAIVMMIMGIVMLVKTIGAIGKTKRVHLIIPTILFVVFCVLGLIFVYECLCMSENFIADTSIASQKPILRFIASLICFAISIGYIMLLSVATKGKAVASILAFVLCILIIVAPILGIYKTCNDSYYEKHATSTSVSAVVTEDVSIIWKDINNSEKRFPYFEISFFEMPIPFKIEAGTKVYLTGEDSYVNGEECIEVFIPECREIGYIPTSSID